MEVTISWQEPDESERGYRNANITADIYRTAVEVFNGKQIGGDVVLLNGAHELGRFATIEEAQAAAPALVMADTEAREEASERFGAWLQAGDEANAREDCDEDNL